MYRHTILSFCALLFSAIAIGQDQPPSWQHVGWGGGGYFWSCAFHPTNENIIYMGGDVLGMYKTEDKGKNWRITNKGIVNYGVYSLATAVNEPDTIYIMTEDGICRSTDAGETWVFLASSAKGKSNLIPKRHGSVRGIAVDPTDAKIVYAGNRHGRVCKSTDAGATWANIDYLPPQEAKVIAHTGKGSLVLDFAAKAPSWQSRGRTGLILKGKDLSGFNKLTAHFYLPKGAAAVDGQLVVQSGDKWLWQESAWIVGKSEAWTAIEFDLTKLKQADDGKAIYCVFRSKEKPYVGPIYVDAVTLHPAAPDGKQEVLGDWDKKGDTQGWQGSGKDMPLVKGIAQSAVHGQNNTKGVIASIIINPKNHKQVYVCHDRLGVFVSNDAGTNWQQIYDKGTSNVAVMDETVYAACGRGRVVKSTDAGKTWAPAVNGMDEKYDAIEILINPKSADTIYCIGRTGWNGTFYRSEDGAKTWAAVSKLTSDFQGNPTLPNEPLRMSSLTNIALNPQNPDELFVAANWRNLFSSDGGKTWEERSKGADITCATDIRFFDGKTYVTAMDEGLFVSEDNGANWKQLAPLRYMPQVSGHMWRTAVTQVGDSVRILATSSPWNIKDTDCPNRIIRSEDGGKTFAISKEGLPNYLPRPNTMWGRGYPRALAVDPGNPSVVYLGIDGDPKPDKNDGGGLYKSTDGGKSWAKLLGQPASRRMFYGLAVDPTDSNRIFFGTCGDNGGVHRSTDGGKTWEHVFKSEGWVFNLSVSSKGIIYAAGKNLWKSEDHGATWKPASKFGPEATILGRKLRYTIVGMTIDPENDDRMWISRVNWANTAAGAIMRTDDGGKTWTDITGDIPCKRPLIVRYNSRTKELWAAGPGIYRIKQP